MAPQWIPSVVKPSRSDEVPDPDHQVLIAEQVRSKIESMIPKRPAKPSRSESESDSAPESGYSAGMIPELEKLQSLKSKSQGVVYSNGGEEEEFTETEYYKELISIDKHHHTTGSGFIKVEREGGEEKGEVHHENGSPLETKVKPLPSIHSNPATNDWIPSLPDRQDVYVSAKPSRSG